MKRVGILGGGQLGSLLLESIYRLGGTAAIYDPDKMAPGCQRTPFVFNASWLDRDALAKFFQSCDVFTYEFENVESAGLRQFADGHKIMPSLHVLETTQDRIAEKTFLAKCNLPHVEFRTVESLDSLTPTAEEFGYPFILKTARGGYDGKGQFRINGARDLDQFSKADESKDVKTQPPFRMVLERIVDIKMEVSCIVARADDHNQVCFPVFENVHAHHILDTTIVPARISPALESKIKNVAQRAANALDVKGLLTTEFFLTETAASNDSDNQVGGWQIYINEFAPRPHNSGHITMKACSISQYDALARILLGVPLSEPRLFAPGYYCMKNLLGDVWLAQNRKELSLDALKNFAEIIDVVDYGKHEPREKRKMGHAIAYSNSAQSALASARDFRLSLMRAKEEESV